MVDDRCSESRAVSLLLPDLDVNAARGLMYLAATGAASGENIDSKLSSPALLRAPVNQGHQDEKSWQGQTGTAVWRRAAAT